MSKEPQVGDVWKSKLINGLKYVILSKADVGVYVLARYKDGTEDIGYINEDDYSEIKYLGKSKANIEQLFETENKE
jgi:hypothetical protein